MRKPLSLGLMLAGMVASGCLVSVEHVSNPAAAFDQARDEAQRQARRGGKAHKLKVLAYDPDEAELTRVSLPLWLCRKAGGDIDLGESDQRLARTLGQHLKIEDLEKAGRGVLVEVEEQGGEQVLVWLE